MTADEILVAVCTYRRPGGLRTLLDALAAQSAPCSWRVLVVDNDPARSAEPVVRCVSVAFPRAIVYVSQPHGHLVAARNSALDAATSTEAVLFVDDDEIPDPSWLAAFVEARGRFPGDVLAGPVRPHRDGPPPVWAPDLWFFTRPEYADEAVIDMVGDGNTLLPPALHADLRLRYDPAFDGIGAQDIDLFARWKNLGGTLRWVVAASVRETVPDERTRIGYSFHRSRVSAYSWTRHRLNGPVSWLERAVTVPVRAGQGVALLCSGWVARDAPRKARGYVRLGQSWGTLEALSGYRPASARKRPGIDQPPA